VKNDSWQIWLTTVKIIVCIVYCITYVDVGLEATSLRPQCRYDTIRLNLQ